MNVNLKRLLSLLLLVLLVAGLPISAMATTIEDSEVETEPTIPPETEVTTTEPQATYPVFTESTVPLDTEIMVPSETEESTVPLLTEVAPPVPTEVTKPVLDTALMSTSNDGIATAAAAEIIGNPTTFASLFLWDTIYIPSFGRLQSKEHIPLYSVYLKNQPGYENNYYIAYCVEPGITQSASANYDGNSATLDDLSDSSTMYTYLSSEELKAMGVVLMYGQMEIARRADAEAIRLEKLRRWAATQIIIWEIAAGWRSSSPPYVCNNSTLYDAVIPTLEIASQVWGNQFMLSDITSAYDEIEAEIARHFVIPSFASEYQSSAPVYELTPTGTGYTITLTDTNNILGEYSFTNTDQVQYSVSGNKLTINVSGDVTGDIVVSPTKNVLNLDKQVFWFWEKGSNQRMMSCKTVPDPDPDPCYFILRAATNGSMDLTKTTEDGKNLAGWKFSIYSNSSCTNLISGPHVTDASGNISIGNLPEGTVYVKEVGHTDSAVEALYNCASENPQRVTITSGRTAEVSFYNKLAYGTGKIVKTTTNGGPVSGWEFEVRDSSGAFVGNYVTDSAGVIVLDLKPDTYTVTELFTPADYWINDPILTKSLTVEANETSTVSFRNQYIGKAKIVKELQNPECGTVEGWTFELRLPSGMSIGEYTTDASGTILLDMEPGTYTVTEILDEDSAWQCVSDLTQTVVVEPGQTAEVIFVNALKSTEMIVQKVNTLGEPLSNAEFLLEWSENGSNWEPVIAADVGSAVKGGCTAVGLLDGKLITGEDGTTHFTGLNPDLQYRLTETKAPTGYQLLTQAAFEGTIPMDDNQVFTVTVVNAPEYVLPMTGSKSPVMMAISLLICVAGCIGALKYFRRKDK